MKLRPYSHAPSLCRWSVESNRIRPLADLIKLSESCGGFIPSTIDSHYLKWARAEHRAQRNAILRNARVKSAASSAGGKPMRYPTPTKLVPHIIYL